MISLFNFHIFLFDCYFNNLLTLVKRKNSTFNCNSSLDYLKSGSGNDDGWIEGYLISNSCLCLKTISLVYKNLIILIFGWLDRRRNGYCWPQSTYCLSRNCHCANSIFNLISSQIEIKSATNEPYAQFKATKMFSCKVWVKYYGATNFFKCCGGHRFCLKSAIDLCVGNNINLHHTI